MRVVLVLGLLLAVSTGGCIDNLLGGDRGSPYDYIRDSDYRVWHIEIDYSAGVKPDTGALALLRDRMDDVVKKDRITTQVTPSATLPSRDVWTFDALESLRDKHQDKRTGGDTVVTYVMYVDGVYEKDGVVGIAWGHDTVAIFKERIQTGCTPLRGCLASADAIEDAVLVHEFGHVLGLVNNGIPMVNHHEGSGDGRGHSDNSASVMWHQVDGEAVFGLSNIPTRFDADDRADLCKAGGACP